MGCKTKVLMGLVCGAMVGSGTARAGITVHKEVFPVNSTLAANGWIGVKISLVADAQSVFVTAADLGQGIGGDPADNGINGPLHQGWVIQGSDGSTQPSLTGIFPSVAQARKDSFFFEPPWSERLMSETNNLVNRASNPPFNGSPLTDVPADVANDVDGADYGVGTKMTLVGTLVTANYKPTMDVAFVIIPAVGGPGSVNDVYVRGSALDQANRIFPFFLDLNQGPEPGTMGLMGAGVAGLLMRRRGTFARGRAV